MLRIPEKYRVRGKIGDSFGAFELISPDRSRVTKTMLFVIASNGNQITTDLMEFLQITDSDRLWEHVSVHAYKNFGKQTKQMLPTWTEMAFIKEVFWEDEDVVFQLHPSKSQYINNHEFVLHLWRNPEKPCPLPPPVFVGR